MGSLIAFVAFLLLNIYAINVCHGGITSGRKFEETPDMSLDNNDFRVPPGCNAPRQVHIMEGEQEGRSIIVSWVTTDAPGSNTVLYWEASNPQRKHRSEGTLTKYKFYNYTSGFIHHCTLQNLQHNTKYYYMVGIGHTTPTFWFTTPPPIGPHVPYTFGLIALLCILLVRLLYCAGQWRHRLPPGPRGYPLVGALPLLGGMPHLALARMAKAYGPIMYLKVGTWGMVVASTPDSARAFLKTLDANFSNRPPNAGPTLLAYGAQDLVFAPYGPKWRLLRKICNLHMLGGKALEAWADVRSIEVGHTLQAMHLACHRGEVISVPEMLYYATTNMVGQVIFSQRVFGSNLEKEKETVKEFMGIVVELLTTAGYFNIGDYIPCLAWMDLQGIEKGMKLLHKKFDRLITRIMDDHLASAGQRSDKPDFLDILMALNRNNDHSPGEPSLTTTNIKGLLLNLLTAGTDTSSTMIEWALAEMMQNPAIQKRAHEEMDRVIGRNRCLSESDLPKLTYLKAICKEASRKHPSTPLTLPRIASEACVVNGYHIPKNTRLSVNIWAIGRDPCVWENPLDFNPERFLSGKKAEMGTMGNDFELIPFGAGRRMCAGARMGSIVVEYVLGALVQAFEWRMPDGEKEMNMEETFGLALRKAVPLTATLIPRLPPQNYRFAT